MQIKYVKKSQKGVKVLTGSQEYVMNVIRIITSLTKNATLRL